MSKAFALCALTFALSLAGCTAEPATAMHLVWFGGDDVSHGGFSLDGNHTATGAVILQYNESDGGVGFAVFAEIPGHSLDFEFVDSEPLAASAVPGHPGAVPLVALESPVELAIDGRTAANPGTGEADLRGRAWAWRSESGAASLRVEVQGPPEASAPTFEEIVFDPVDGPTSQQDRFSNPSFRGRFVGLARVDAAPVPEATQLTLSIRAGDSEVVSVDLAPQSGSGEAPVEFLLDHVGAYEVLLNGRGVGAEVRLSGEIVPPPPLRFEMEWSGLKEGYDAENEIDRLDGERPQAVPVAVPNRVHAYQPERFEWRPVLLSALAVVCAFLLALRLATHHVDVLKNRKKK